MAGLIVAYESTTEPVRPLLTSMNLDLVNRSIASLNERERRLNELMESLPSAPAHSRNPTLSELETARRRSLLMLNILELQSSRLELELLACERSLMP